MPNGKGGSAAVINIDQLLAPDITFEIAGERWTMAGNISARTTLRIQELINGFQKSAEEGDVDATVDAFSEVHDFLLPLFQYKRPELTELPWEFNTVLRVLSIILARALGADPQTLAEAVSDPPRTTSTPPTRSRSTRPTGSARS